MKQRTHKKIDSKLWGVPVEISERYARVELEMCKEMKVDELGLIHGGAIFGLGDYAAMLAVNHPNVVLAGANVRFLKPARVGDSLVAEARVAKGEDKKKVVDVVIKRDDETLFTGEFICVVLKKHVLESCRKRYKVLSFS